VVAIGIGQQLLLMIAGVVVDDVDIKIVSSYYKT